MSNYEATPPLSTRPLDWFVDALLQSSGQLMLIIDHMARFAEQADTQSERSIDETLRELITGVLERELRGRDPAHIAAAATLLAETTDVIADEIMLVEPDGGQNGI